VFEVIKTFAKGGVHPPDLKLSAGEAIKKLPPPEIAIITMSQHLGSPATPIVKRGDTVKTGQLIAQGSGFVSARVHSSVSGTVAKIDDTNDPSGYRKQAVFINVEGDDWEDSIIKDDIYEGNIIATSEEIIKKIEDAGIVGLGGATFPAHIKLSIPKGKKADILIINGVECEPYLTADHSLMLLKGREIITGVRILMKALKVDKALIGIENNKSDAIINLKSLVSEYPEIEVIPLHVKYPQGGEKQLINALTGREVPSGRLPVDAGAVAFNVGTAFAVYEAVQKNKPLFERVVTVTGKFLSKPSNFMVRIGTPVSALIDAVGGVPENTGKIISGGPMMGKALSSIDVPVNKGCSGILLLPSDESQRLTIQPCVRCAKCVSACPMGLEPYLLMALAGKMINDGLEYERVMDCIECGSCSFICPANRPLLDFIRLGKSNVGKIIRSRNK